MTREELESLGWTDDELRAQVRELFGSDPALDGDDVQTQAVRGVWFRAVVGMSTIAATPLDLPPMGTFGDQRGKGKSG